VKIKSTKPFVWFAIIGVKKKELHTCVYVYVCTLACKEYVRKDIQETDPIGSPSGGNL